MNKHDVNTWEVHIVDSNGSFRGNSFCVKAENFGSAVEKAFYGCPSGSYIVSVGLSCRFLKHYVHEV